MRTHLSSYLLSTAALPALVSLALRRLASGLVALALATLRLTLLPSFLSLAAKESSKRAI